MLLISSCALPPTSLPSTCVARIQKLELDDSIKLLFRVFSNQKFIPPTFYQKLKSKSTQFGFLQKENALSGVFQDSIALPHPSQQSKSRKSVKTQSDTLRFSYCSSMLAVIKSPPCWHFRSQVRQDLCEPLFSFRPI